MIKKVFFILFSFLIINQVSAFDIREVNNAKVMSKASYALNDTNLVDKDNAESLLENATNLSEALIEKEKEIIQNNKNRSQPKYKGAGDIFSNFSKSVVFIGNRKNNRIVGVGSGFIIEHKGKLKIITNWHVVNNADSLSVWTEPSMEVDENYLISKVDSYSAKLIKENKTKDLAMQDYL